MNMVLGITGSEAAVLTENMCASLLSAGHAIRVVETNPSLYFLQPDAVLIEADPANGLALSAERVGRET
jgi:hypothetical protein